MAAYDGQNYDLIGIGSASHSGARQGSIISIEVVTEAITIAKKEAEAMAGVKVSTCWLGVGGEHIEAFSSSGMVAIRNKEVSADDILRVIEAAKAVAIPSDRTVLHVLPVKYKIDKQDDISDPIGMAGVRLEAGVGDCYWP